MPTNQRVNKREKAMAEFVVVIIVFAILMKIFINYFSEQEQSITKAGFTAIAKNFHSTVLVVRAQWLMDKQPKVVQLTTLNKEGKTPVTVNNYGWLDAPKQTSQLNTTTACENIWQLAMTMPMQLMKLSIAAIELRDKDFAEYRHCRYFLSSGEYFDYYSKTGQVSKVKQAKVM